MITSDLPVPVRQEKGNRNKKTDNSHAISYRDRPNGDGYSCTSFFPNSKASFMTFSFFLIRPASMALP